MSLNKIGVRFLGVALAFSLTACGESETELSNEVHLSRAQAYQDQGQYKAATIEYRNAVKKSAGGEAAFVQYADMLNDLGRHDVALSFLEQVKAQKSEQYYLELVETFVGMGKYLSADATLKDYLPSESRDTKLLEGRVLSGLGEFKAAGAVFDALLATNAADNEALLGKATVEALEGRNDKSLELLAKIKSSSEAFNKGQILVAGIQIKRNQLDEAEATLSDLLSKLPNTDIISPEKTVVLKRLSYVLTRQGRSNEAYIYTKVLSEAFPGSNEAQEQYKAAVEKFQAKELDEAQAILLEVLEKFPSFKQATQLLGVISYLRGDNQLASKYLSESVDPEVANPLAKHVYAATNLKLNEPKKVLKILGPGIENSTSAETLSLYGLAAISDKQYSKGESALLKSIELDDSNIRVRLALAGFYRSDAQSDKDKELYQLEEAYKVAPNDVQVLKEMVGYYLRFEGKDKTQNFVSGLIKKSPNDHATNLIAGYFYANNQEFNKALGLFEQAVKNKKTDEEYLAALLAKGKAEVSLKQYTDASKTFEELAHAFPENQIGYRGLLSVFTLKDGAESAEEKLVQMGKEKGLDTPYLVLIQSALIRKDVDKANEYLLKVKELNPENNQIDGVAHAISYVEAVEAMQMKDFEKARELVASILISQPDNLRVLSFLVDLEIKAGKPVEASKVLEQLEELSPSHPVITLLKGDIALISKKVQEAKSFYSKSWLTSPTDTGGEKLFKVLGMLREKAEQSKHLTNWVTKFPNSPQAVLFQAVGDQQKGDRAKAIVGYEKVLKAAPNNVMALNNLGWIYFEKGDDAALDLLKKATELAPGNAAVLDSYGWVLAKSGKVDEGLVYLEEANKLAPNVKEISDHLATVKKM